MSTQNKFSIFKYMGSTYVIKYDKYNQTGNLIECVELCNSKTELHTKIQELYEKSGYYKELPHGGVNSKNETIKMITVYDILMNKEECNWVDNNCEVFEASGKKTAQQYKETKASCSVNFAEHMLDINGYL